MNARVAALLLVLTLSAGYVDAVAFFGLGVFTANMTGNTVLLGGAIAGRFVPVLPGSIGVFLPALSIGAFVAGTIAAALVLRRETGRPPARTIAVLFANAFAIAAAALLQRGGTPMAAYAIALLSAVMGTQSVIAVRAGVEGVSTTFVTGTIVSAVMRLSRFDAGIWACYLGGALAGGLALRVLGPNALWVPAVVVAALAAMV